MVDDEPRTDPVRSIQPRTPGRRRYDLASWEQGGRELVLELERRVDGHDDALENLADAANGVRVEVHELVQAITAGQSRQETAIREVKINQRWILLLGGVLFACVGWVANEVYRGKGAAPRSAPVAAAVTAEARIEALVDVVELVGHARGDRTVTGAPTVRALVDLAPHLVVVRAHERDEACRRVEVRRPGACSRTGGGGP